MVAKQKYTQRMAVARKTVLSADEFEALANDPHPKIRMKIAQRSDATQAAINRLSRDTERNIRIVIAQHKSISAEALAILADDPSSKVRANVVRNKNIGSETLLKLSKDDYPKDSQSTAKNWNTPFKALEFLAVHKDEMVRIAVAKNVKTPIYILRPLLNDESQRVQHAILKRQDVSEKALLILIQSPFEYIRQLAYQKLLSAKDYQEKHNLIENMSRDKAKYIRGIAAQSKLISETSLLRLVNDDDSHVRHCAALNPCLSLNTLEKLSTDENDDVRSRVAENPNCSSGLLSRLADDVSDFVRREVAKNNATPLVVLKKFVVDPSHHVRIRLTENKAISTTWLRENFPKPFLTEPILRTLKYRDMSPPPSVHARNPNTALSELINLSKWKCDIKQLRKEIGQDYEKYGWTEEGLKRKAKDDEMRLLSNLAANPVIPIELLDNVCMRALENRKTSSSIFLNVIWEATRHPNMTQALLDKIVAQVDEFTSSHDRHVIKKLICSHPKASPESLSQIALSKDACDYVYLRAMIALNPSTTEATLITLAHDSEFIVKFRLVQRANIPSKVAAIFVADPVMAEIYQERLKGSYSTHF